MEFIRPEVRAAFWHWREVIAGVGLAVLGGWALLGAGGLLGALGGLALVLAAVLIWTGLQRGRFRGASGGPGTVDVDEGQVTYFGPLTGGAVALRDMETLALIRSGGQSPHWRLTAAGGDLHIPTDADGADDLFDAFTTLPGLRTERMVQALRDGTRDDVVIWQRGAARAIPAP